MPTNRNRDMGEGNAVIEISGLLKHYHGAEDYALNKLTLNIFKGEVFGILGPNGAGKTTLFSILSGILPYSSGSVKIEHKELQPNLEELKLRLGIVPQEIGLYPSLSAIDNLLYIGRMYGLSGSQLKEQIDFRLHQFGLTEVAHKPVKTYSGGMKRRVNLIAGILHRPEILILDEPTEGMDVQSRAVMMELMVNLNKEEGMTILYTSHYLEQVEMFCDRIGILNKGELVALGTPGELLHQSGSSHLEALFLQLTGAQIVIR